jgi:hypothetical protein
MTEKATHMHDKGCQRDGEGGGGGVFRTEPECVNVYGAKESTPPDWESVPGLLKRSTNSGSEQETKNYVQYIQY